MQPEALKTFNIVQDLIMGLSVPLVCAKHSVPVEEVVEIMNSSPHFTTLTPSMRKQIALARLDACAAATMTKAVEGDVTAINTFLKIQEREAKLAGLDSQTEGKASITVNIPWLSQERLSYKHDNQAQDANVLDLVPVLEAKAAKYDALSPPSEAEALSPSSEAASHLPPPPSEAAWKEPPPDSEIGMGIASLKNTLK